MPHVEAVFIDEDKHVYMSSGVPSIFRLDDTGVYRDGPAAVASPGRTLTGLW